jgi:hypothetical protein
LAPSSTLFSTQPALPACPSLPKKLLLRAFMEGDKKPNFIEFYKSSRLTLEMSPLEENPPTYGYQ